MHLKKRSSQTVLEESAHELLEKAEDCFKQAKDQQKIADQQHEIAARQHRNADKVDEGADKLTALGYQLEANAVEIRGESDMISQRGSTPCPDDAKTPVAVPAKSPDPTTRNG